MSPIKFKEQDLFRWAGSSVFGRGKEYFQDGNVLDCYWENGTLWGEVKGSLHDPYEVKIDFNSLPARAACTCPFDGGEWCKHAVALSLEAIHLKPPVTQQIVSTTASPSILSVLPESKFLHKPILRIMFQDQRTFGISSKGLKIKIFIGSNGQFSEFNEWSALSSREEDYRRSHPPKILSQLNSSQMGILKLLYYLRGDLYSYWDEARIQEAHVGILFDQIKDVQGIELFCGKKKSLILRTDKTIPTRLELSLTKNSKLQADFSILDPDDLSQKIDGHITLGRWCWLFNFISGRIFAFDKNIDQDFFKDWFYPDRPVLVTPEKIPSLMTDLIPRIKGCCEIIYHDERLKTAAGREGTAKFRIYLDYIKPGITARLEVLYGTKILNADELPAHEEYILENEHDPFSWIKRDKAKETEIVHLLIGQCAFRYNGEGQLCLSNPDDMALFLWQRIAGLQTKAEIFYSKNFKDVQNQTPLIPEVNFDGQGVDWFYFNVKYRSNIQEEFSHEQIRKQLASGKNYLRLKNGAMIPIDRGQFEKMEGLLDDFSQKTNQLPVFHVPFLLEETKRLNLNARFNDSFLEIHKRLKEFRSIKTVKPPKILKQTLRDYQRKGLDWLNFLREFHFGGILADEMGLGKTLQVLSLIQKRKEDGKTNPSLVVCPTTLVWNWQAEINKFLPGLNTLVPAGPDRRGQLKNIRKSDIVITSYALLRRDVEYYAQEEFDYIILDEAQNIKNRHTLNARVSKQLKSSHRLVLTGTPMENSVADLWSIFDFLMPGYLGGYERFRQRYELPIIKEHNNERLQSLACKIKPFLLRRLKTEVIRELPEKIEQIGWCELEPTQYRCYEQMLGLARRDIVNAYQTQGLNKGRMLILTILLRLRQICCHPQLAGVNLGHQLSVSSKLNLLKELLGQLLGANHKVLIFSQFTEMLKIIAEYLDKEKISYEYMDGKTRNRRDPVERFNQDPLTAVFLLSLKVGGVGLNLTAADTVILFEPWWNPAVENQAIDRTHRIGQQKTVMAYKLICKGTIEEKILELQKRKKNLIDSLIVAEEGAAKSLDWEDIKFLLDIK